jgi:hypothetical protein
VPVSSYYGGDGEQVLRDMIARYGATEGKRIFYATANARGLTPKKVKRKRRKVKRP